MARISCAPSRLPHGVRIIDAEVQARKFPTFEIPPREARRDLAPGDFAKLVFRQKGAPGERMWVIVKETQNGCYEGILDNDPVVVPLKVGRKIRFGPRHVIDVRDGGAPGGALTIFALMGITSAIGIASLIRWRKGKGK